MPEHKKTQSSSLGDIVRKRFFDTQRADVYPNSLSDILNRISNFVTGKTVEEQNEEQGLAPIDKFSKAGFSQFQKQGGRGIVEESEFRPEGASEEDKFFTFRDKGDGSGIREDLLRFLKAEKEFDINIPYPFKTSSLSLRDTGFSLGHFTINKGSDERGSFIDVQDKYDFDINDPKIKKFINPKILENITGGEGFNIYDRVYYNEDDLTTENLVNSEEKKPWGLL